MKINRHRAVNPGFLAAALAGVLLWSTAAAAQPTFSQVTAISAPPGTLIEVGADEVFDNAGTNPRFTGGARFRRTDYLESFGIRNGLLYVQVKSAADLNAFTFSPRSPFTVDATVTMTNDEGETAEGRVEFETEYDREEFAPPQQSADSSTAPIEAPPGIDINIKAEEVFDNAGNGPEFINAEFSTTDYYNVSVINFGVLFVRAKTDAELNALESPPDSPFTVTAEVTMRNKERVTATATLTFQTSYVREDPANTTDDPGAATAD